MRVLRFVWLSSILMILSLAQVVSAAEAGKAEAQNLVKKAIETYKSEGKDKLIAAVNKPKGSFDQGELYVFLYDMNGVLVANPVKPELVGKNVYQQPDDDGKLFRKEIVDNAKSGKSGWVDYKTKNPSTGKLGDKVAYYEPVGDLIAVAGIYKN